MRTAKRYSNQTFTKHVDDDKGRHRTLRSLPEPAVCEVCGDVYADRRWSKPDPERTDLKHKHFRAAHKVVCPACERQRDGVPSGFVYVEGKFFSSHSDEIKRLLENETERAGEDNPLARIMNWLTDAEGRLTISTTTEHLAQRLGHALSKAFHGKVRYGFSHRNKLAHVWWRRD
ncbi:MAG TPA: BCAM0308 family protein [Blastocatellia bacterium]|nr:BCAM0308 family protein [Blastocatellia bacterium]HMV87503.1 BCAM0308 family protein [Blastocatellia bacterium]HMX30130.1 BCAM0308 family protein [Blastocatellia bacterium]HMY73956.1 BCAM0308 family protein [Blastocatellia bacterium]HMZ22645.1 BCAM0308 family protein [Blastocatellia bacterium]